MHLRVKPSTPNPGSSAELKVQISDPTLNELLITHRRMDSRISSAVFCSPRLVNSSLIGKLPPSRWPVDLLYHRLPCYYLAMDLSRAQATVHSARIRLTHPIFHASSWLQHNSRQSPHLCGTVSKFYAATLLRLLVVADDINAEWDIRTHLASSRLFIELSGSVNPFSEVGWVTVAWFEDHRWRSTTSFLS